MTTQVEVIAPSSITEISWNGELQDLRRTEHGTLMFDVPEPPSLNLPTLHTWKVINRYNIFFSKQASRLRLVYEVCLKHKGISTMHHLQ